MPKSTVLLGVLAALLSETTAQAAWIEVSLPASQLAFDVTGGREVLEAYVFEECVRKPNFQEKMANPGITSAPCNLFESNWGDSWFLRLEKTGANRFALPESRFRFSSYREAAFCLRVAVVFEAPVVDRDFEVRFEKPEDRWSVASFCVGAGANPGKVPAVMPSPFIYSHLMSYPEFLQQLRHPIAVRLKGL
jgi:hypothetical protein